MMAFKSNLIDEAEAKGGQVKYPTARNLHKAWKTYSKTIHGPNKTSPHLVNPSIGTSLLFSQFEKQVYKNNAEKDTPNESLDKVAITKMWNELVRENWHIIRL